MAPGISYGITKKGYPTRLIMKAGQTLKLPENPGQQQDLEETGQITGHGIKETLQCLIL